MDYRRAFSDHKSTIKIAHRGIHMSRRRYLCLLVGSFILLAGTSPAQLAPDTASSLRTLYQSRLDAAKEGYLEAEKEFRSGNGSWERLASWSKRWLESQRAMGADKAS